MKRRKKKAIKKVSEERFTIYGPVKRFQSRKSRVENQIVHLDLLPFLDNLSQRLKRDFDNFLRKFKEENGIKIIFVVPSHSGRSNKATTTGMNIFRIFQELQANGLIDHFYLSYQSGGQEPSTLCRVCRENNIPVIETSLYSLTYRQQVVVPKNAPGKAENVMVALSWLIQNSQDNGWDLKKTAVFFVDDDYTCTHKLNYWLIIIAFLAQFIIRLTGDKEIDKVLSWIKKPGLIKSGSPRLNLPQELQDSVVVDGRPPFDYLGVAQEFIQMTLKHKRYFGLENYREEISQLIKTLKGFRDTNVVFAPFNRSFLLSPQQFSIFETIWKNWIAGDAGRATWVLKYISWFLRDTDVFKQFSRITYLLHGDQGCSLDLWKKFSFFQGYALETGLIFQALYDNKFKDYQLIDVVGLPHAHQRSKQLAIEKMITDILAALDLLRLLYKQVSLTYIKKKFTDTTLHRTFNRFGDVREYEPQYSLKVYPPLQNLTLKS